STFPVVVTAIEALLERQVNVGGMICSMHAAIPLVIVNGPIRHRIGLNCAFNVFGQGWRANATIGRVVQLSLVSLGGAKPGEADRAPIGQPGNFTFCIAENEEESPWDPLHVARGLRREDSAVTVIGAEPPHSLNNQAAEHPRDLLHTLTTMMANAASMNAFLQGESVVVHAPEHAHLIARFGWTKNDVRQYLFEHARTPIADL
ncbi:MAG: hypothetical protein HY329_14955, partial [Chloroflexi bacterium]|nr:hypothetical protein [Chloroflexota bacterium]